MTQQVKGATVKGIGFIGIFKFIKIQHGGEDLLKQVQAAVSQETTRVIGRKVITVMDYPYSAFAEFLHAADKVVGFGDLSLCEDIGEYAANRDYEFFFASAKKKLEPADLFRDCNIYWRSYYLNAGFMKTEDGSPDHTVVRIHGFPGMDPAHCRLMNGWMAQSMLNAGAVWTERLHETKCMGKGHEYHEFSGRWRLREAGESLPAKTFVKKPRAVKA